MGLLGQHIGIPCDQ